MEGGRDVEIRMENGVSGGGEGEGGRGDLGGGIVILREYSH